MISGKMGLLDRGILKERYIPALIIWVPVLSIIVTAAIITVFFFISFNNFIISESENLRTSLLDEGKKQIQEEVVQVTSYIDYNRENSELWLKGELKSRIDMAYSIIKSEYEYNRNNKSDEEIIDIIRETFRNVRFFDGRGYYFIHRLDLKSKDFTILQPNMPSLEGDHQLDDKDSDGKRISETAYNLLTQKGEGFLSFNFYLDDSNKKEKKLAYVKLFKPLNIFIGTGEYLVYFEESIKKDVLKWLENYRFRDDNYIFVYDNTGNIIMHPIIPSLVNRNIGDLNDSRGYNFGKEYLQSVKSSTGVFVSYNWKNPATNIEGIKIGYAHAYKDWGWNVGAGLYMDSLEENVLKRQANLRSRVKVAIFRTFVIVVILISAVFIITFIFARFTASLFSLYKQHINESAEKLKDFNRTLEKKVKEKTFELEKKNTELEQIATVDSLSGIYNRRYFDIILKKEWFRHMRNHTVISLIMCDIDFFKQYNDAYGHQKGDECIQFVAKTIKNVCQRPIDIPVRYGGEEFAIILPQTDVSGALKIAKDVQKKIEYLKVAHESSSVSKYLTLSFGIAAIIPSIGQNYSELIKVADTALYRAKENGRNRIES